MFRRRPKRGVDAHRNGRSAADRLAGLNRKAQASRHPVGITGDGEGRMKDGFGRRDFLKGAVAGSAVAATTSPLIEQAQAQPAPATATTPGYAFLNLDEAAFV